MEVSILCINLAIVLVSKRYQKLKTPGSDMCLRGDLSLANDVDDTLHIWGLNIRTLAMRLNLIG